MPRKRGTQAAELKEGQVMPSSTYFVARLDAARPSSRVIHASAQRSLFACHGNVFFLPKKSAHASSQERREIVLLLTDDDCFRCAAFLS